MDAKRSPEWATSPLAAMNSLRWHHITGIGVMVLLLIGGATSPVAAASNTTALPAQPALLVQLQPDGDARVLVTIPFDLSTTADRNAFRSLQRNETKQATVLQPFETRLERIAGRAENTSGREMRITDVEMDFSESERGERGIVILGVTWHGLAVNDGSDMVVTVPFANGFTPDRRLIISTPKGYTFTSISPTPTAQESTTAAWSAGTSLDGFRVEVAQTASAADSSGGGQSQPSTDTRQGQDVTEAMDGQPGFGLVGALVAVVASGLIAALRRYTP